MILDQKALTTCIDVVPVAQVFGTQERLLPDPSSNNCNSKEAGFVSRKQPQQIYERLIPCSQCSYLTMWWRRPTSQIHDNCVGYPHVRQGTVNALACSLNNMLQAGTLCVQRAVVLSRRGSQTSCGCHCGLDVIGDAAR